MHSIYDVQDVYPNSPAAAAGLHSFDDFIIGTDSSANEVRMHEYEYVANFITRCEQSSEPR